MSVGTGRGSLTTPQFFDAQDILAVIAAVLRIVSEAWGRVLGEGVLEETHRHDEPRTAGLLRSRMLAVERERNPRIPAMKIKPEVGVTAADEETVVRSIDIEIIYSLGDEADLRLECKRVSTAAEDDPAGRARYYVKDGVLRFVGKYGWERAWGIMIAFVLDGDCEASAALIGEYIGSYRNEPPHVVRGWRAEARFGMHRHLFNSLHRKTNGSRIELLHLFLPFARQAGP